MWFLCHAWKKKNLLIYFFLINTFLIELRLYWQSWEGFSGQCSAGATPHNRTERNIMGWDQNQFWHRIPRGEFSKALYWMITQQVWTVTKTETNSSRSQERAQGQSWKYYRQHQMNRWWLPRRILVWFCTSQNSLLFAGTCWTSSEGVVS